MMSNCKLCLADCAFKGKDMKKGNCKGYIPMTNADRIRAMSDEELAVFLCAVKFRRETILNVPDFLYIKDAHDWLQQLYEGE